MTVWMNVWMDAWMETWLWTQVQELQSHKARTHSICCHMLLVCDILSSSTLHPEVNHGRASLPRFSLHTPTHTNVHSMIITIWSQGHRNGGHSEHTGQGQLHVQSNAQINNTVIPWAPLCSCWYNCCLEVGHIPLSTHLQRQEILKAI